MNYNNIQVTKFVNSIYFVDSENEKHVIDNAEAFQFYMKKESLIFDFHNNLVYRKMKLGGFKLCGTIKRGHNRFFLKYQVKNIDVNILKMLDEDREQTLFFDIFNKEVVLVNSNRKEITKGRCHYSFLRAVDL